MSDRPTPDVSTPPMRSRAYAPAVLWPASLLLVGLTAIGGTRIAAVPAARGAALDALERVLLTPGDPQALESLGRLLSEAVRGSFPGVVALAVAALNLSLWLCVRIARRRRAVASRDGPAASTDVAPDAAADDGKCGASVPHRIELTGAAARAAGPAQGLPAPIASAAFVAAESTRAQLDIALAEVARLREAAARHEAELRAARESRARFVTRMSHALRTPLNGIIGMSEMLAGDGPDDERRRRAARLTAAGQNLVGVVNGLLDQARLESGELRLQRSRFALHDAIEDGCQRRSAEAHARGVELVCYIDEDVPKDVDGDGNRLWQVVDALVANAIEHTDRGEVVVRVARDGDAGAAGAAGATGESDAGTGTRSRYRCDVQDTGCGLSPERQLELWRIFRADIDAATGPVAGTDEPATARAEPDGSGLRTASELVRRMGGELDVRGRLGEGARFSFTFELGDVAQSGPSRAGPRTLRGVRALVVDDNETNRTILAHQLGNWGMHVESADGGEAALAALRAADAAGHRPDLLVLDLHMPGMDGLELARRIAADPALRGAPR